MTQDRVVVLGGGGFVGRHVCAAFTRCGWDVTAVTRHITAGPGVRSVRFDLCARDGTELDALLDTSDPDVVVNAAGALWGVPGERMRESNVDLVARLLGAVRRRARQTRFVQLGTAHEYGPAQGRVPITEATVSRPVSHYGATKSRATELVLDAATAGELDAVVLRIGNVIGSGAPEASLLGRVGRQLLTARRSGTSARLELFGLGSCRDYVDADDVTRAVVAVAKAPVSGRTINIGRGEPVSTEELVTHLIKASGVSAEIVAGDGGEYSPGGATEWQVLDIGLAWTLLGWRPRLDLSDSAHAFWASLLRSETTSDS